MVVLMAEGRRGNAEPKLVCSQLQGLVSEVKASDK